MAAADAPLPGLTDQQRQMLAFFTYETALTGLALLATAVLFAGDDLLWLVGLGVIFTFVRLCLIVTAGLVLQGMGYDRRRWSLSQKYWMDGINCCLAIAIYKWGGGDTILTRWEALGR